MAKLLTDYTKIYEESSNDLTNKEQELRNFEALPYYPKGILIQAEPFNLYDNDAQLICKFVLIDMPFSEESDKYCPYCYPLDLVFMRRYHNGWGWTTFNNNQKQYIGTLLLARKEKINVWYKLKFSEYEVEVNSNGK